MPHLQGTARDVVLHFPLTLDEYIRADNPVRFIDAFVDQLDLQALGFKRAMANPLAARLEVAASDWMGFKRAMANPLGRPAYAPAVPLTHRPSRLRTGRPAEAAEAAEAVSLRLFQPYPLLTSART